MRNIEPERPQTSSGLLRLGAGALAGIAVGLGISLKEGGNFPFAHQPILDGIIMMGAGYAAGFLIAAIYNYRHYDDSTPQQ